MISSVFVFVMLSMTIGLFPPTGMSLKKMHFVLKSYTLVFLLDVKSISDTLPNYLIVKYI